MHILQAVRHCLMCALYGALVVTSLQPGLGNARAQSAMPDPATIDLPDPALLSAAANSHESIRYYYLSNDTVTFSQAYSDFADCYRFVPSGTLLDLAVYVPWVEDGTSRDMRASDTRTGPSPYGIAGAALGAVLLPMFEAANNRAMGNTRLRACMVPRGYVVHPLAQSVWALLHRDGNATMIARLAKLATMHPTAPAGEAK